MITYTTERRPALQAGEHALEVTDISEMGLRTYNEGGVSVGYEVRGTIALLCGEAVGVEGMIVRKNRVHLYVSLEIPIPKGLLEKEQQHLSYHHSDS